MITYTDYFRGRDAQYPAECTPEVKDNAEVTRSRANALLAQFGEDRDVTSGWRPAAVNAATPGAAVMSRHLTGEAIDIYDPEGDLDEWCLAHLEVLEKLNLWMEHPASTKGWCHLQTAPPKSGNRVFYP